MARDMYLVGVDEEELKPDPKPEKPKGFKGKWDNYWYHYKWVTIGGAFALFVIIVLVVQMVTREEPDYRLVLVTDQPMSQQVLTYMTAEMEVIGLDRNGDGAVKVDIENLYMGDESQMNMANQQKLPALIAAGDDLLFAFEPAYYEKYITGNEREGFHFFAELGWEDAGVVEDGRIWNWKDGFRNKVMTMMEDATDEARKAVPENLYFGVRDSSNEKKAEEKKQYIEFLHAFATDTPLKETTVSTNGQ